MLSVVVLAGDIRDDATCLHWLGQADDIVCADGGARHLQRLMRPPHLLVGDLDSVGSSALAWIYQQNIPVERHPVRKDETDAELAIAAAIRRKPTATREQGLIVLGALGSRPDHVMATQMLAASLARPDRAFLLTDGISRIYTLVGGQTLTLTAPAWPRLNWTVSLVPLGGQLEGLTYTGLDYPLTEARLELGSTRGVSNRFTQTGRATVRLGKGLALVFVTTDQ